jgi:single-stranded-DNA-specific exonuclease
MSAAGKDVPVNFTAVPVAFAAVASLERELGVSHVTAQVLARRGLADVAAARTFLAGAEAHQPSEFRDIGAAVAMILSHAARGSVITVHGDYDCDGVCSTAILVEVLRELGADVDWYLPDRAEDGYGLAAQTVERLASRGTALLITTDCGITAVSEVAAARAAGIDVVVTDHHTMRADGLLPSAPIVHPALCGYPCPDLCATAVAAKLAQALREASGLAGGERERDLELVALATIADVVPLVGENRRLVRAGLRALVATVRPGLRALMRIAHVEPLSLDERTVAFRLAPRLNAAGRLHRPDVALELLLCEEGARAEALAKELDRLNYERRDIETRIRFAAEALASESGPAPAYVLAGAGWHPGVIGIVAARIAERHHRPAVLIALPDDPTNELAVGSARSIAAFDLLGGLQSAGEHLSRFGGHRAAAGLQIRADAVDAFRSAFVAHAGAVLGPAELSRTERIDAVADGEDISIELVEEFARLAPFGAGNRPIALLLPAATLSDAAGFGGEGRSDHARFSVHSGRGCVRAVAFGAGARLPAPPEVAVDAAFSLERNEWRGAVEPRLILRNVAPCAPSPICVLGEDRGYLERAFAELERRLDGAPDLADAVPGRSVRDRRGRGIAATITELVRGCESVLVVCAAAAERARHLDGRLGGFALCSHDALERGAVDTGAFEHIVILDPPLGDAALVRASAGTATQYTHLAWGQPELRFAVHIYEQEYGLRDSLAACYRTLRDRDEVAGGELEAVLRESQPRPRSPEHGGRLLRVLAELGLVTVDRERSALSPGQKSAVTLEQSPAFRHYEQLLKDGVRYLEPSKEQAA